MAISQVRAQLNGQWYTLTYNPETRTYQTTLTPDVFSGNQPGGYYNIVVEATNDSGAVATTDGNTFASLKLVVLETTPPTLTIISPPPGYVTNNTPAITCTAVDNAGGSGIDPSTASVALDGEPVPPEQITITVGSGGAYTIVYTPASALSDGEHTVAFGISDNDGNSASTSAVYTIDTTPPQLMANLSFAEVVTDAYTVVLSGNAIDIVANPVTVNVSHNGEQSALTLDELGNFNHEISLSVGENSITVTATDAAGLSSEQEFYLIRLITDRTQNDIDRVNELAQKMMLGTASTQERDEWLSGMRGAYNATDLNRVNMAMEYLNGWITDAGYATGYVDQGIEWTMSDIQVQTQMAAYLNNVVAIGSVFTLENPPSPPESIVYLTYIGANAIEKILVLTDKIHPLLEKTPFYSGEVFCGEV